MNVLTGIVPAQDKDKPGALLNVFPNPSNGNISLSFAPGEQNNLMINISDLKGNIVYSETNIQYTGEDKTELDLTNIPKGIYFLNISTGGRIVNSQKVVLL